MKKNLFLMSFAICFLALIFIQLNCSQKPEQKTLTKDELIARGKYLVNLGACNKCHSPKVITAMGSVPDTSRLLSGHPASDPPVKIDPGLLKNEQLIFVTRDYTEWIGPWGVSFTANLTPDNETGLGTWTEDLFIKAIRSGKHMGIGRPILEPMTWKFLAKLKDEDLKSIFAYLQSLPAIHNQVPDPVPPDKMAFFVKK
jgi:hypothetical protein